MSRADWQLRLFRVGLLACAVLAIVVVTQFSIIDSVVAIWNGNPTADATAAAVDAASEAKSVCLSAETRTPKTEYPSHCYRADAAYHGMPGDQALANVKSFLVILTALFALLLAVVLLGLRMARESRAPPPD